MAFLNDLIYRIVVDDKAAVKRVDDFDKRWQNIAKGADRVGKAFSQSFNNIAKAGEKIFFAFEGFSRISAPVNNAIETFGRFDRSMREIGTLMSDVTERDILRMGKETRKMAVDFAQDIDKMAKARYDAVSAGFTGMAESMELVSIASKLAVGGVADVAETNFALTKLMNAYSIEAQNAVDVSDVLFTTVRLGQTTIPELAKTIGNVGEIAKTSRLSLQGLGASMSVLTRRIETSEAVNSLRAALFGLLAAAPEAKAKMDEMGISIKHTDDGMIDLIATMRQFAGRNLDDLRRFIPERLGSNAVAILANNLEELSGALDEMNNAAGATEIAFEKIAKSPAFALQRLRTQATTAIIAIGNAISPLLTAVTKIADAFSGWDAVTQKMVAALGALSIILVKLTPILLAAGVGLGPIGIALSAIAGLGALVAWQFANAKERIEEFGQVEFNALINELTRLNSKQELTNDEQQRRNVIIQTLQREYPDYLKNMDLEKKKNEELRDIQREVNATMTERIRLRAAEDDLSDSLQRASEAQREYNRAISEQAIAQERAKLAQELIFEPVQLNAEKLAAERKNAVDFINSIYDEKVVDENTKFSTIIGQLNSIYQENSVKAKSLEGDIVTLSKSLEKAKQEYEKHNSELKELQDSLNITPQPTSGGETGNADAAAATKTVEQINLERQLNRLRLEAISNEFERKRQAVNLEINEEKQKFDVVETLTETHHAILRELEAKRARDIAEINAEEISEKQKVNLNIEKLRASAIENEFDQRRAELEIWYAEEQLKYAGQTEVLAALATVRTRRLAQIETEQQKKEVSAADFGTRTEVTRLQIQTDPNEFNRQRAALELWFAEEQQKYLEQASALQQITQDRNRRLADNPQLRQELAQQEIAQFTQITEALAALAQIRAQRLGEINKSAGERMLEDWKERHTAILDVMSSGFDTFINSLTDTTITGAERFKRVWESVAQSFLRSIGDMLKASIEADIKSALSHQAAEKVKTAATKQGVLTRIGAVLAGLAKEVGAVLKSIGAWLAQAAAKLYAFFAGLGPIGALAGLAAIPAMIAGARAVIKSLAFFAEGGIVRGPTLGILGEAGSPEAAIPLNQKGADFIAALLPKVTVVAPSSNVDFGAFAKTVAAEIQNVKIEIQSVMDGQRFLRNEIPEYNRNMSRRKL